MRWLAGRGAEPMSVIERIPGAVIGDDAVLEGPFGPRRLVYADGEALTRLAAADAA